MNDFIKYRITQNIIPISIPDSHEFLKDIFEIEKGYISRIDLFQIGYTFVLESAQLLTNSIHLFELGYIDNAYYSLRTAIELSTTLIYFSDMPEDDREKIKSLWKNKKHFPQLREMLTDLSSKGYIFSDMHIKLEGFIERTNLLKNQLNKYVHKQGFDNFYVVRKQSFDEKTINALTNDYSNHLTSVIGIVAIMRLAIDPFPILLMDEEILFRAPDFGVDAYSQSFVEKYIGNDFLDMYKNTLIYTQVYESFISEEKKNMSIFNITQYQMIDVQHKEEIFRQLHLLTSEALVCSLAVLANEKIFASSGEYGLPEYISNRRENVSSLNWSSSEYKVFREEKTLINYVYKANFISRIELDQYYFFRHSALITDDELHDIVTFITNIISNIK